jgi:hypothetical protein
MFGNGFESQILLLALHKLRKQFFIVYTVCERIPKKTKRVLRKFGKKHQVILLQSEREDPDYKTWIMEEKALFAESNKVAFSATHYCVITGHKASEPSLMRGFQRGDFDHLVCPFLRCSDEYVQSIYQDMKDHERMGKFLWTNNMSDSHHNIEIL